MSKIILASTAGYCFGVRRAVKLAFEAERGKFATLGPIIHNGHVVRALAERGIEPINSLDELADGKGVIIRSHGVGKAVYEELEQKNVPVIDATCPDVRKIHRIVQRESREGRMVVIIGDPAHPEVRAIAGWCDNAVVLQNEEQTICWLKGNPHVRDREISVVSQTTNTPQLYADCCENIKKECTNLKIFDTICGATCKRQAEAADIAKRCDLMIVVGDRNSSNTKKLFSICAAHCSRVCLVESAMEEISVKTGDTVGITAGASTPDWIIKEVVDKMSDEIIKQTAESVEPVVEETVEQPVEEVAAAAKATEPEEDFAAMLEDAIKTLNTGDKVTGVVTAITPTEVYVDLGTKHAGYIPIDQISDDPNVKPEDVFKVGDEVECYTMRVNDMEGTAQLSKKRLDAVKNWDNIEKAYEDKTVVEGVVTEENKGGVVVSVKGVRVFVPASQTGVPRGESMSELLKKTVRLRITEVNRARRRVVGSIRAVTAEERRAAAEKIWSEIEVGKVYKGVVKSMTSYGAFIDIGGIDGMAHVSELSWNRIHNPSEVLKVGDEVDVNVLSFDPEKRKISLGYLNKGENPWNIFMGKYQVGSILEAKIVKLMPFGAFAEVIPGVDGLIHISQIADRRIGKPEDVLSEGEVVTVKIIDIDEEKKKISLSIRALLTPETEEPVEHSEDVSTENQE